ncbi:hypothetical protein KEM55_003804, partial [Ascosphaera atra]
MFYYLGGCCMHDILTFVSQHRKCKTVRLRGRPWPARKPVPARRLHSLRAILCTYPHRQSPTQRALLTICQLLEVPSNLVLRKFHPSRYLATITTLWGIIATLTGITQNLGGLICCRLLLGAVEAGLFPGLVAYMTLWYGKREIALRVGYLFSAAAIAGACGGLLAYAIGHMDGVAGQRGWRWIFIIEGMPSFLLGGFVWWLMADDPDTAYFLNKEERRIWAARRALDVGQTDSAQQYHKEDVVEGFKDWKVHLFAFSQVGVDSILYGYSTFLPTIIHGIGNWTVPEVQCLTIPCYFVGAVSYIIFSWISDKTQKRGMFT